MTAAGGSGAPRMTGPDIVTASAVSLVGDVLTAPFSRRTWAEFCYLLVSVPLAVAGFAFALTTTVPPALAAVSAPGVRKLGDASRSLAHGLLGEDLPAPPRPQRNSRAPAWRVRGYLMLKLPLAAAGGAMAAFCWLLGALFLTFPAWWAVLRHLAATATATSTVSLCRSGGRCTVLPSGSVGDGAHQFYALLSIDGAGTVNLAQHQLAVALSGAALLLTAPWVTGAAVRADRLLIGGLLGPASLDRRVRTLQETRARVVDDSAARLRGIERDLHDGTQAQLVALAMKLGLAREKLGTASAADMARVAQLVDDAHRGAIEAIADLRVLARGIHPPVLDNGLADALATLAARSALPVELITDIPERPSAAIETIAYFSAAELLTNTAKHSGARHVTLEAIHVPGLLRVRVSDDGSGGARAVVHGGLRGLADRVRTVDGRLDISSPPGGPTVVTVELPSRA